MSDININYRITDLLNADEDLANINIYVYAIEEDYAINKNPFRLFRLNHQDKVETIDGKQVTTKSSLLNVFRITTEIGNIPMRSNISNKIKSCINQAVDEYTSDVLHYNIYVNTATYVEFDLIEYRTDVYVQEIYKNTRDDSTIKIKDGNKTHTFDNTSVIRVLSYDLEHNTSTDEIIGTVKFYVRGTEVILDEEFDHMPTEWEFINTIFTRFNKEYYIIDNLWS